jgi:hypothetical protein
MKEDGLNLRANSPVLSYKASVADLCLKATLLVFLPREIRRWFYDPPLRWNIGFYIHLVDDIKPLNISRIIIQLTGEM